MTTLKIAAILACTLFNEPAHASTRSFLEYRVNAQKVDAPKLELKSHPVGRRYRTVIRTAVRQEGANFAGGYTLAKWGCGSSCLQFAIVDLKTGRIFHQPGLVLTRGLEFRSDSALLKIGRASCRERV